MFTIIIPIYNSEKYLDQCLESVLAQTYTDFEVICVNDGSTDNSLEILNKFSEKDKRIKVINQVNQGQGKARNKGLELAQGKYIYFLDSDDYIDPNLLEEALKIFKTTDTELVCFNTEVCGDSESILFKRAERYAQLAYAGLLDFTAELKDLTNIYIWNKVFKAELIKKYGIRFPKDLCYEDITFSKTYFLVTNRVYFDMRRFHHYTIHENSLMDINFRSEVVALDHFKNWYEIFKIIQKDRQLLTQTKDQLEKWFWDYYFMTKRMVNTEFTTLETLKEEYFKEFEKLI